MNQTELDSLYKELTNNENTSLNFVLQTNESNNTKWTNEQTVLCQFTGNQKTVYTRKKRAKVFVNVEGDWQRAVAWIKVDNEWKRCV